jgi:uncharacterized protein (TIGR00106 family)
MIVEISAVPVGVGQSVSRYVAEVIRILEKRNLKFQLNPMGTVIEIESFSDLGDLLNEIDSKLYELGSSRNYYVIKIDSAKKKMEEKLSSVIEKL